MIKVHTSKKKFIVASASVFLFTLALLFGVLTPLYLYIRDNSIKLQDVMIEQVTAQAKFHDGQEITKDLKAIQPSVEELKSYYLGDDRDLSNTLSIVENLAKDNNLSLNTQLLAGAAQSAQLSLSVEGNFFSVMNFLRRLEQFPKFSKIESFNMGSRAVSDNSNNLGYELDASFSFVIYSAPLKVVATQEKPVVKANNTQEEQ